MGADRGRLRIRVKVAGERIVVSIQVKVRAGVHMGREVMAGK